MITDTKTITDSEGNRITYDLLTREIIKTVDKHGFIYNKLGERIGNVHNLEFIAGYHNID